MRSKDFLVVIVTSFVAGGTGHFFSATSSAATVTTPEVLKAQRFELVDKNGETRAWLRSVDGEPALMLYDHKGTPRAVLSLYEDEAPGLILNAPAVTGVSTRPVASLMGVRGDGAALTLEDRAAHPRVAVFWGARGGGFAISDASGKPLRDVTLSE